VSATPLELPTCLTIALTGGIASGKTTVANRFAANGATVVDADLIARDLVAPGQPALHEIVSTFGNDMIAADGSLDRRRMRERVFGDASERRKLEAILHPRVRTALLRNALACTAPYCLLAIPLLAESERAYDWIDRVLVVDVPRDVQLTRLMLRDGMTEPFALRALATQVNREQRLARADDVIDNAGAPDVLDRIVARLHRRYLDLSSATGPTRIG
jgi:dephospho-CoA kinase